MTAAATLLKLFHEWNDELTQLENEVNEFVLAKRIGSININRNHCIDLKSCQDLSIRMKALKRLQEQLHNFLKTKCMYGCNRG